MTFPSIYPNTFHNEDKRGLFLHGYHYDAVMPASGSSSNDKSYDHFVGLWKSACKKKLQECPICFRDAKLSDSHIIPESMLCMCITEFKNSSKTKTFNPDKVTERLLCGSTKSKDGYKTMELGCEQMLSSSEEVLADFLAGSKWKKRWTI